MDLIFLDGTLPSRAITESLEALPQRITIKPSVKKLKTSSTTVTMAPLLKPKSSQQWLEAGEIIIATARWTGLGTPSTISRRKHTQCLTRKPDRIATPARNC